MTASGIEKLVCDDISVRQTIGTAKYGTTVLDNKLSLRAWLQHAYEEGLDQVIYLRRAIHELDDQEAEEFDRNMDQKIRFANIAINDTIDRIRAKGIEPLDGYPSQVCVQCGTTHGKGPIKNLSCWHQGVCDICGKDNVAVTEPRDFGHLYWPLRRINNEL